MKICMAAKYAIDNPMSWSGTPLSLYNALKNYKENEITTLDVSEFRTAKQERLNLIKNLDVKKLIKDKKIDSKLGPAALNPIESKILWDKCKKSDYDVLFEFGGFLPNKNLPPYFVYSDSSHDLKLDYYNRYGYFPFNSENDSVETIKKAADFVREIYQKADGVLCMSQWMADSMIKTTGVSPDKVHVVYAGANWHNMPNPHIEAPKNIADKKEVHLILTGVDFKGKGVDIATKANEILNRNSDVKYILHVCGIREDFKHDDNVINHGFVNKNDLQNLLLSCDLFVLPSRFDCFGISFVEAMTYGLPCIGRNICAMPEIIDEGINGELIHSDDADELASLINKICSNSELYEQYSASAINKAKKFTWENVAEDIMQIMKSTVK